jgi:hypothetical protein
MAAGAAGVGRSPAGFKERMSVNSVATGLLPSYGPLSGNSSQSAKYARLAQELPEKASVTADAPQITSAEFDSAPQGAAVASDAPADASQFQSTLEQALREGGAAAGTSASGTSASPANSAAPGIALYKRVSQYSSKEPSTSALLKSWNSIMQSGQDQDSAGAAVAKALLQNAAPGFESRIVDLTA